MYKITAKLLIFPKTLAAKLIHPAKAVSLFPEPWFLVTIRNNLMQAPQIFYWLQCDGQDHWRDNRQNGSTSQPLDKKPLSQHKDNQVFPRQF